MNYLNYKSAMLCVLCIFLFFGMACFKSTPTTDVSSSGGGSTQTTENYLVTSDGSSPTSVLLETEYNEFLILKGETSRKIYFGGRATSQAILNNVRNYWLQDLAPSKLWDYQDQGASITDKWEEPGVGLYYSGEFYLKEPTQTTSAPESETIQFKVGYYDPQNTIAVIGTKNVDFRYEDSDARDFPVDIYEQTSHNFWNNVAISIVDAYTKMGVKLIPNLIKTDLADADILDFYNNQEFMEYAMIQIYPDEPNYSARVAKLLTDYPTGKGFIFNIRNYTNGPKISGVSNVHGTTLNLNDGNHIYPSFVFVFSEAINDLLADNWELEDKALTTIHELGHLWCKDFTDGGSTTGTHGLWHNGYNSSQCAMLSDLNIPFLPNGEPDSRYQQILSFHNFCEGHLQRGMNVSWKLKQWSPFGEQNSKNLEKNISSGANLLASLDNHSLSLDQPTILIKINTDQKEYIKGELFQIDVEITNNDVNLLELQSPQLHHKLIVRHLEDNYEFTVNSLGREDLFYRELLPGRTYNFSVTPSTYMTYTEEGLQRHLVPGYYWKEGTYQIEMVIWNRKNEQYESNVYEFVVKPVPEQYKSSFNILRHKSRSNLAPTYKDMMKLFLSEKASIYQYEMFYLLSQYASNEFKIERVTDLTIDLKNALTNLILEKPNKQYIIQYVRHIKRFVNESKDLQAVAANKAFLTELADSVKTLSAKEPQRYEKLVQVLSGEEEQVFKN